MGIRNLMKYIEYACRKTNLRDLDAQKRVVAIDTNCLIHKALYTDQKVVIFIKRYVKLLRSLDFQVILVFDGLPNPTKAETNEKRVLRRRAYRDRANDLLKSGNVVEAMRMYRRCTTFSREEVCELMYEMRKRSGVEVIEAPYEADAQLAFLATHGLAEFIITEDSDLVVYGCEKIIFKLRLNGDCILYERNALNLPTTFENFRKICILSGCDYLPGGLKGMGIKKGMRMLSNNSCVDTLIDGENEEFTSKFKRAEDTFLYQIVYDPVNQTRCPLNPSEEVEEKSIEKSDLVENCAPQ